VHCFLGLKGYFVDKNTVFTNEKRLFYKNRLLNQIKTAQAAIKYRALNEKWAATGSAFFMYKFSSKERLKCC
jgi:hypothetical protein